MSLKPVVELRTGTAAAVIPSGASAAAQEPAPVRRICFSAERAWLVAALALALLFAWRAMAPDFSPNTVQDDARHYVFWMERFHDPELFPNDLIADYLQWVAPPGYTAFYWVLSWVAEPMIIAKVLPIVLGLTAALFTFLVVRRLHPEPVCAFLAAVLLSWYVWQVDDVASASPRSFLPILVAQVWSLVTGRARLAVAFVALGAAFHPVAGALGVALLGTRLIKIQGWRPGVSRDWSAWGSFLVGAALVVVLLLPGQLQKSPFGPVVSVDQARAMPDFGMAGREFFFVDDAYAYWVAGGHSGFDLRARDRVFSQPILFLYLQLALLLPLLLVFRPRIASVRQLSGQSRILLDLTLASMALFFLAHLLLFHLYHPSRYVKQSLPLVLAISAGLGLGILFVTVSRRFRSPANRLVLSGFALASALYVVRYPANYEVVIIKDEHPAISSYLRTQPKDTLVAGVPTETDFVPTFANRSVLVNKEYFVPFHLGFHGELRQRMMDLIDAYYAESSDEIVRFALHYGVDVMLVNRLAFQETTYSGAWTGPWQSRWEPFSSAVDLKFRGSRQFVLPELALRCGELDDGVVTVVSTACVQKSR
jgi:hypothetical protein